MESSKMQNGSFNLYDLKQLENSFDNGDITFDTLERLNETEANYLYRMKVIHAKLPALPN